MIITNDYSDNKENEEYLISGGRDKDIIDERMPINKHEAFWMAHEGRGWGGQVLGQASLWDLV